MGVCCLRSVRGGEEDEAEVEDDDGAAAPPIFLRSVKQLLTLVRDPPSGAGDDDGEGMWRAAVCLSW